MIKMTFDKYYSELERMKGLNNPTISADYGITANDIKIMKKDPEKYVYFCMYLLSRPWYDEESDIIKEFVNADALPQLKATEELVDIVNDALELYDEEDTVYA